MLDPMNMRLANTLSDERLKAAEQSRRRRNWTAEPTLIARLRAAIASWANSASQQPSTCASRHDVGLSR
jgi:hypothetical protein